MTMFYVEYDGVTGFIYATIVSDRDPHAPFELVFPEYIDTTGKMVDVQTRKLIDAPPPPPPERSVHVEDLANLLVEKGILTQQDIDRIKR